MDPGSDSDSFEIVDTDEVAAYIAEQSKPDLPRITAWLQPTDYAAASGEYARHLSSQAPGTGDWIRETSQFEQWHLSKTHGALWIKAVPGAGKSVLAAAMVESLGENEGAPVMFFFFRQIIEKNRSARGALRDWLAQLVPWCKGLQRSLWEVVEKGVELDSVSTRELWELMKDAVGQLDRVYCVVDALDEMDLDEEFLTSLNELGSMRPAHVKVLMTSRPKQYLQSALRDPQVIHVSLEEELVKRDIAVFVRQRAQRLVQHGANLKVQRLIQETVCERSNGLFLYARLMLDQIEGFIRTGAYNQVELQDIIARLPVGLEEMYNRVLQEHAAKQDVEQRVQVFMLQLITHAARPLRLIEIAAALGKHVTSESQSERKTIVRNACGPLLEVMEDEVVQVLHHSFTEFLCDETREERGDAAFEQFPVIKPLQAHHDIAIACLESLISDTDKDYTLDDIKWIEPKGVFRKIPFIEYSAGYWFYHAKRYDIEDETFFRIIDKFCEDTSIHFAVWKAVAANARGYALLSADGVSLCSMDWSLNNSPTTRLHVAVAFDLVPWAKHLIRNGADVNAVDGLQACPLAWAAKDGRFTIIEMLLGAVADPNKASQSGLKPLHLAARRGHVNVVKLFLSAGVSPVTPRTRNFGSDESKNPLRFATQEGHAGVVLEMIPYTTTEHLEEALCCAVKRQRSQVARVILDHSSVSANCLCKATLHGRIHTNPQPVLMVAAKALDPECVKLLLDRGASVSKTCEPPDSLERTRDGSKNPHPQTALHKLAEAAIESEKVDVARATLKALLNAGADLEAKDGLGNTPLLIASRNFHAAGIFIEAGANLNAVNEEGESLLYIACNATKNNEMIELLLEHNANPTQARKTDGATPIHCYIYRHCFQWSFDAEIFKRLTVGGTHINVQDAEGNTPLHLAAFKNNNETALKTILGLGADVNLLNYSNRTCLHAIKSKHHISPQTASSIKILVEAGLNIEVRDRNGLSVLLNAVTQLPAMIKTLLELPTIPEISTRAPDGKTVLHLACKHKNPPDLLSLLLDSGADPLLVDNEGNTLLHEIGASFEGFTTDVELVQLFISAGVPIDATNEDGKTAAHMMKVVPEKTTTSTAVPSIDDLRSRGAFSTLLLKACPKLDLNPTDNQGYTPLHYAARSTALNAHALIKAGADIRVRAADGRTPLHCAALAGNADMIRMILESLTDSELAEDYISVDLHGYTPLHCACASFQPECVRILKDAGANVPRQGGETNTVLTLYHQKVFQMTTTAHSTLGKPDSIRDPSDTATPLHYRRNAIFRILTDTDIPPTDIPISPHTYGLSRIVEPASESHESETLSPVVQNVDAFVEKLDDTEVARLLARGFEFTQIPLHGHGKSPISQIVAFGMVYCMEMILDRAKLFDNPTFLRTACERFLNAKKSFSYDTIRPILQTACNREIYNMEMVKLLVEEGKVDVNAHCLVSERKAVLKSSVTALRPGNTALHVLAEGHYWWQLEAVKYLVSQGAEIDSLDENGRTPLHIASTQTRIGYDGRLCHFRAECCKLLLQFGANPNHVDDYGLVPLNRAGSDLELVKILLQNGASVNIGKKSPLTTAIELRSEKLLRLYLEHGANPNVPDTSTGNSVMNTLGQDRFAHCPLFLAVYPNQHQSSPAKDLLDMTNLLIDHGANLNRPINEDQTLVHFLFENVSSARLRPFLEKPGLLDPNLKDQKGRTVFMAALASRIITDHPTNNLNQGHAHGSDPMASFPDEEEAKQDYLPAHQLILNSTLHSSAIDFLARDAAGQTTLTYYIDRITHHKIPESCLPPYLLSVKEFSGLVHAPDVRGFSPLHNSIRFNYPNLCFQLLDEYGANILQRGPGGDTCLHYIAKLMAPGLIPLIDRFITASRSQKDAPASVIDVRNDTGQTPLLAHLSSLCPFCFDPPSSNPLLLPPDPPTTPPEWELPGNRFRCLKTLLSYGADPLAVDENGHGALHVIARYRSRGAFEWLMAKGCDPLRENREGRSALDVAATTEVGSGPQGVLRLFRRKKEK